MTLAVYQTWIPLVEEIIVENDKASVAIKGKGHEVSAVSPPANILAKLVTGTSILEGAPSFQISSNDL